MSERLSRGRCGPYPPVTHRNCLTTTEQGSDPEAIEKAGKKLGKGLFASVILAPAWTGTDYRSYH